MPKLKFFSPTSKLEWLICIISLKSCQSVYLLSFSNFPPPLCFLWKYRHVDFVWSFARLLCLQSRLEPPPRCLGASERGLLVSFLNSFSSKPYIPSEKVVIVDPSVQKPVKGVESNDCPTLDNQLRDALEVAIQKLLKAEGRSSLLLIRTSAFTGARVAL